MLVGALWGSGAPGTVMDAILEVSVEVLLEQIPVEREIKAALLGPSLTLPIAAQVNATGATWLDGQFVAGERAELADEGGEMKACKRMSDVGFDGFADGDSDVRAGWRETLAREGKLRPAASSVRDLVLGDAESSFR